MQAKRVSVVGCGWYGHPLADLLKSFGWTVKGSKSSHEGVETLLATGIEGHYLRLDPQPVATVNPALFDADILILNIPPPRRADVERYHLDQMYALNELIEGRGIQKVLFISSTSVYPDVNRSVTECDKLPADKPVGRVLQLVEAFWLEHPKIQSTILRFGGLVGRQRIAGRFLAGKQNVKNGDAPVNLIHLDDCLAITAAILQQDLWGEILNACCPEHPTRREFYQMAARKAGLKVPTFSEEPTTTFKKVDPSLLINRLDYRFRYPDPLEFPHRFSNYYDIEISAFIASVFASKKTAALSSAPASRANAI